MKTISLEKYNTLFFDLFYTLTAIEAANPGQSPTHEQLGVTRRAWVKHSMAHYYDRGVGKIKDPYQIIRIVARSLKPEVSEETIKHITETRIEKFRNALIKIPGEIIEVLETLKRKGKKIGLISNADYIDIQYWNESPLAQIFHSVTFSCLVGSVKPEEKIYRIALEALDTLPEKSLFIGDGGNDELMGARRLGMSTVMTTQLTSLYWPEPIPGRRPFADYEISHLNQLLEGFSG